MRVTITEDLSRNFDLDFEWNVRSIGASAINATLPEQTGLRLESRRGPVPVLVIDSIDTSHIP